VLDTVTVKNRAIREWILGDSYSNKKKIGETWTESGIKEATS
jgi:hypothetical protein